MFQTVRHWWTGGRGKVTARLFVFEFVVVVAGVLVAQGLASEVQRRDKVSAIDQSDRLAQSEMESNYGTALVWRNAAPCLNDRLAEIMRRAATGPIPSALAARPRIEQLAQTRLTLEDKLILREVKGAPRADLIDLAEDNVENFSRHTRGLTESWGRIELADPQFGVVSAQDRAAARAAAADIRAHLRAMGIIGDDIIRSAKEAGMEPIFGKRGSGPARSCAAIWTSGRINPPLAR